MKLFDSNNKMIIEIMSGGEIMVPTSATSLDTEKAPNKTIVQHTTLCVNALSPILISADRLVPELKMIHSDLCTTLWHFFCTSIYNFNLDMSFNNDFL